MSVPLLSTKLHIPPARPSDRVVERRQLLQRLDGGLVPGHVLTLVSAPPGYGKTTLLTQWIARLGPEVNIAWLSLDAKDDDPVRFLSYLVAAVQVARPGTGQGVLAALRAPRLAGSGPGSDMEPLLTALVNDLASQPGPLVLVFEDYHTIVAPAVHRIVEFLVDHIPETLHLVLVTRADPPWALGRLRGRRALIEIRMADLRFGRDDSGTLLNGIMNLDLPEEDIGELIARTEGWVTGLHLAGLACQGLSATGSRDGSHPLDTRVVDRGGFVRSFSGDDSFIVDYLVEEVLRHQPEHLQAFLLETSILDALSGPLCDAVTGRQGSQALLEELERSNLFLEPLDSKRRWYRYHQLLSTVLRNRLQASEPGRMSILHARASAWHLDAGNPVGAVEHGLAAADYETVADLIERDAWDLMAQGVVSEVFRWLDALPSSLVRDRPRLRLLHAWALMGSMQLCAAAVLLSDLEQDLQDHLDAGTAGSETMAALSEALALRATVAGLEGDPTQAISLGLRALVGLPDEARLLRGVIANTLGAAYYALGDVANASDAFEKAAALSEQAGNTLIALISLGNLASLHESRAQLHRAAAASHRALRLAAKREAGASPASGMAKVQLSRLQYEWNHLSRALEQALGAVELGKRSGITELCVSGLLSLARIRAAQGDRPSAVDALQEAQSLAQRFGVSAGLEAQVSAAAVQHSLRFGTDPAPGARSLAAGGVVASAAGLPGHFQGTALARKHLAAGRMDEAEALLDGLRLRAEAQQRYGHAIEVLVLQSLAARKRGDAGAALEALKRALALAEPEGYVRTFVDEGYPMAELLHGVASEGFAVAYIERLLDAFSGEPLPATRRQRSRVVPGLFEPLSDRELEVLRLIAAGFSNREIAGELVLTVGTVKWHANNIYGKLGVHSRTQAIARAQDLNLLSR